MQTKLPKMKHLYLSAAMLLLAAGSSFGQYVFDPEINQTFTNTTVVLPPSPLKYQVLFIGGEDMVQVVDASGNPDGEVPAKEWHDFIGFTSDSNSSDLGWISVNHEMIQSNAQIGDGGGMTAFKVKRDPVNDTLIVVEQTLSDGRQGKFFNVDFANTVGETGMNCGGMVGPTGRVFTAEEWFRSSNASIYGGGAGVTDTSDYTIASDIRVADGQTVAKYENFNWMVEIDPIEAKAIRKQYNWGRQPFEGGATANDNKTVYLGADDTPGFFTKFVADNAGDFTSGKTYVFKHDDPNKWVEIDNGDFSKMLDWKAEAVAAGGTMFNRLEWVAIDRNTGMIYMTETGRDNPGSRWSDEFADGAVHAPHNLTRAAQQGFDINGSDYWDYYGRVLKYDPSTQDVSAFVEGGPYYAADSVPANLYPNKHLSNPDGLSVGYVHGESYMIIQEDLNGTSHGRVPGNITNRTCEAFLLNLNVANPTINDLTRISVVPQGAEITGATFTPDGKTILINVQHPSSTNPFPYNHSLTYAITGWDKVIYDVVSVPQVDGSEEGFSIYPNPAFRELRFNTTTDIALYDVTGKRILVKRNVNSINVEHLEPGNYFIQNAGGETRKLVIQ